AEDGQEVVQRLAAKEELRDFAFIERAQVGMQRGAVLALEHADEREERVLRGEAAHVAQVVEQAASLENVKKDARGLQRALLRAAFVVRRGEPRDVTLRLGPVDAQKVQLLALAILHKMLARLAPRLERVRHAFDFRDLEPVVHKLTARVLAPRRLRKLRLVLAVKLLNRGDTPRVRH